MRMMARMFDCGGDVGRQRAAAEAQVVVKHLQPNEKTPIANGVWAGDTLYLSGQLASPVTPADAAKGTAAVYGDTKTQAVSALTKIQALLKEQGLDMKDVVKMTVFLAGDPANGGKLDFAGTAGSYTQFFGTAEQPNKPARSAFQVAALAAPWALVEIEVIAVKEQVEVASLWVGFEKGRALRCSPPLCWSRDLTTDRLQWTASLLRFRDHAIRAHDSRDEDGQVEDTEDRLNESEGADLARECRHAWAAELCHRAEAVVDEVETIRKKVEVDNGIKVEGVRLEADDQGVGAGEAVADEEVDAECSEDGLRRWTCARRRDGR